MKLTLTHVEVNHLISLMDNNEREGWYFAPREQYWKRHERIKEKLCLSRSEQSTTAETSNQNFCSDE